MRKKVAFHKQWQFSLVSYLQLCPTHPCCWAVILSVTKSVVPIIYCFIKHRCKYSDLKQKSFICFCSISLAHQFGQGSAEWLSAILPWGHLCGFRYPVDWLGLEGLVQSHSHSWSLPTDCRLLPLPTPHHGVSLRFFYMVSGVFRKIKVESESLWKPTLQNFIRLLLPNSACRNSRLA